MKAKSPAKKKAHVVRSDEQVIAMCDAILDGVAQGASLSEMCRQHSLPESTFRIWALQDRHGLSAKYATAREIRADVRADEIDDIAQECRAGIIPPDVARVVIDAKKWSASKLAPGRYGERQRIDHSGSVEVKRSELTPEDRLARIAELRDKLGI